MINSSPLIDGVFVPDGESGHVQITSKGHQFEGFHDTSSLFWIGIQNDGKHFIQGEINEHYLTLAGTEYGTLDKPAIFIHANQGITFDLEKIREVLPEDIKITQFTSLWGLSDSVLQSSVYVNGIVPDYLYSEKGAAGDFYLLIDGKLRCTKIGQHPTDSPVVVNLPIKDTDRFLTIATTQSASAQDIGFVWALLGTPYLHLEAR
jgi:hypothetical protein